MTTPKTRAPRFGIGEWFGYSMAELSPAKRREFAEECLKPKRERTPQPCPFQSRSGAVCSKDGGVCSLRSFGYVEHVATGRASALAVEGPKGTLRATCPYRFYEDNIIVAWIGETLLGNAKPAKIGEVGFLESGATTDSDGGDDVGRIDMVLVDLDLPSDYPMNWCAVEIQAVYFSGAAMIGEFKAHADPTVDWLVYPAGLRRPDYRSSAPKRLMPQLQIKVPTLRRWGKKMAVVVDRSFFDSLGAMDDVAEVSNADIAWFIVRFEGIGEHAKLVRDEVKFTTLERSVEGLTGGSPVSLAEFQRRIQRKAQKP